MPRFSRILSAFDSSPAADPPESVNVESDFVVILAALLCALICVVGLIAVARCAWLRRPGTSSSSPPPSAANKGLKKKILHSLPKFTYGAALADDSCKFASTECAICLVEFGQGDELRILPHCGHGFHVACIDTWLRSHSTCPSCRQILVVAVCQKCGHFPAVSSTSGGATAANPGCKASPHGNSANNSNSETQNVNGDYLP